MNSVEMNTLVHELKKRTHKPLNWDYCNTLVQKRRFCRRPCQRRAAATDIGSTGTRATREGERGHGRRGKERKLGLWIALIWGFCRRFGELGMDFN